MEVKKCEKQVNVGDTIIYFDEFGRSHHSLVTACWGDRTENGSEAIRKFEEPSVNLLFISPDEQRGDTYGRQIERRSSCMHATYQCAWGQAWCLPEQFDEMNAKLQEAKTKEFAD